MDFTAFVDPFHGNSTLDLPAPKGIAAAWFFLKAQTGNTHPGACLPFGMISVCPYSGAYVTGYGVNTPNYRGLPVRRFEDYMASGFTHFHQSGTGAIGTYYNYLRVTPLVGGLDTLGTAWKLEQELASPGYYSAGLSGTGIRAELTVSGKAAIHRYTFPMLPSAWVTLDFLAGGIEFEKMGSVPSEVQIRILSESSAEGMVRIEGIPIYVSVQATNATRCCLWSDKAPLPKSRTLTIEAGQSMPKSAGVFFEVNPQERLESTLRIGFSFKNYEQARKNLADIQAHTFDELKNAARDQWNQQLQRIVVSGKERDKRIFYSNLYHSLIKPCDASGESPFWNHEQSFYFDFATMWDQYKTQLPLLFSIYPERASGMVNSLLATAEHLGRFPNCTILKGEFKTEENQARALAHYVIADAFYRKIEGIDWSRALVLMMKDLEQERNKDFWETGIAHPFTHTLDLAGACFCTAQIARHLNREELYTRLMAAASNWKNVYDPATGRLGASRYYEGGAWNYSFRLLHDMASRIALYPSEERFLADLDLFFGYGCDPASSSRDAKDEAAFKAGAALNRFEGFNNEPDMETPWSYIYADRPDRTAEIVHAGFKYMFSEGRGGLPGNDDSGSLSSCYVWNAIGLFPVAGQPIMLIGSPLFDSIEIRSSKQPLKIQVKRSSPDDIYLQEVSFNGTKLNRLWLTIEEFQGGGELSLKLGPDPGNWKQSIRPPSHRMEKSEILPPKKGSTPES